MLYINIYLIIFTYSIPNFHLFQTNLSLFIDDESDFDDNNHDNADVINDSSTSRHRDSNDDHDVIIDSDDEDMPRFSNNRVLEKKKKNKRRSVASVPAKRFVMESSDDEADIEGYESDSSFINDSSLHS